MAEAEQKEERDQYAYQMMESQNIDEVEAAMKLWRKRGNKHDKGDWVMAAPEPLVKNQAEQTYAWIAHPKRPGKGGPEVACRAAYVALMQGTLFDIQGDFSKGSEERKEALEKDPADWPVLKWPNGAKNPCKKKDDSDDEDENYGTPVIFAVRYKDNIYTANTMSDGSSLSVRTKMKWSGILKQLKTAFCYQAAKHIDQMHETDLAVGKQHFVDKAKKVKDALK